MDTQTTLEIIYEEVKKVNERRNIIEQVLIKGLPEAELSSEDIKEKKASIKYMRKGEHVTLEALKRV